MNAPALLPPFVVIAVTTGCFHTQRTDAEALRSLRQGELPAGVVLPEATDRTRLFSGVRIDPNSNVRLRRTDGSLTSWVSAGALHLSDDGLFVSARRPVSWSAIDSAIINELSEEDLLRLRLTAPPGAKVKSATSRYVELRPYGADVRGWLAEFVKACDEAKAPLPGRWTLSAKKTGLLPVMDGDELRAALDADLEITDGVRWMDLNGADVSNLDGPMTLLGIVMLPIALTAGRVPIGDRTPEDAVGVEPAEVTDSGRRILGRDDFTAPRVDLSRPLFAQLAVRRASLRWVMWMSTGSELTSFEQVAATVGGAARLRELFEVGVGASAWWRAPLAQGRRLPGLPLQPGPDARIPKLFAVFRALAHLELDAARRMAVPLGVDVAGAPDGTLQLRLRYGFRVRPLGAFSLSVHPLNAQYTALPEGTDPGGSRWSFPWSVEALADF